MPTKGLPEPRGGGYLRMAELSIYLNVPVETLRSWRATGYGPAGVLMGRTVRYSWKAIRAYEAELEAAERERTG